MIQNISLTDDELKLIQSIIKRILNNEDKAYIFGSRATGNAKPYSDIDIAIDLQNHQIMCLEILSQLEDKFHDSALAYKVDIVDLNNISEPFKDLIQKQSIRI